MLESTHETRTCFNRGWLILRSVPRQREISLCSREKKAYNGTQECNESPWTTKMGVIDLCCGWRPWIVAELVNVVYDKRIHTLVRHQIPAHFVKKIGHFFVTAQIIVKHTCNSQLLNIFCGVNERVKEA
ncbi:hypothetical protein GQ457_11G006950 [Hibiscus cannabinus]